MKKSFCAGLILLSALTFFRSQKDDIYYYRPDIGMYFLYDKNVKKERISYKENWDFYFSLKNDSIAIIQDIKNKIILEPKEYKISMTVDSSTVKRAMNGKIHKTEKMYFRKILI
ncbi:MAG TPA: hypothetical protein VHD35_13010 [Chitinophagaceae bacterium]|nr:hypothetical protein [Chitinophagaceae bacterium]